MRLRLWSFVALIHLAYANQIIISTNKTSSTTTTTLVDALSADPDYTRLLHLLQRTRLIPALNKVEHATFFAPTNEALEKSNLHLVPDNRQAELRQHLLYHLLNYTLASLPTNQNPEVHKTLLFPRDVEEPPTDDPAPAPPWLPLPGGSLGGEPQRVRLAFRKGKAYIGVDGQGAGGAQIVKGEVAVANGVLLGINSVIPLPQDLATVARQVAYFDKILKPDIARSLNGSSNLTVFLPVDAAWQKLHRLERLYLESPFASDDLAMIMSKHTVASSSVTYSEDFDPGLNLTTVDGSLLPIVKTPTGTLISRSNLVTSDIYASNGVLHLVDRLLLPKGSLELTPEKYLLALNCTSFVSLIHSANLTFLINDTKTPYTILAPRDDVLATHAPEDDNLDRSMRYHFLKGLWTPEQLKDGALVQTMLQEDGLDGNSQVMGIEVKTSSKNPVKNIRFGGTSVVGDEYLLLTNNNTIVYFISRPLTPPSDALTVALPFLDLSSFLAAVFSTQAVAQALKTASSKTLFIPHNVAFQRLGLLVSAHLLADTEASRADLRLTLLHHAVDGVFYTDKLVDGSDRTFSTLEGSDISLKRGKSLSLIPSGGWPGMSSTVMPANVLTKTGVIHRLDDLMIPRSVKITVAKLVRAATGTTMSGLLASAGMEWVLNGTAPPADSPYANLALSGWTLLCPHDDAFDQLNLTQLKEDPERLQAMMAQHLIPSPVKTSLKPGDEDDEVDYNNLPVPLADDLKYTTLLSSGSAYADVVFRTTAKDKYVVGLKGVRGTSSDGDWATVLAWGRASSGSSSQSGGVIQIDRVLVPYYPPWWLEFGPPVLVAIGGSIVIFLFFGLIRWIWQRDATEATYEPIGGFGADDDEET